MRRLSRARHHSNAGRPVSADGSDRQGLSVSAIGRLFQDLRRCFGLTEQQVAVHIQTSPAVIRALESGAFELLPPWPETCRVVAAYTSLASIDPRPVLQSIGRELALRAARAEAGGKPEQEPEQATFRGRFVTALEGLRLLALRVASAAKEARFGFSGMSRPTALIVAVAAMGLVLTGLVVQSTVLQAAVTSLPSPVVRLVRGAHNYMLIHLSPTRDGLRWIEVEDPRSRRTDKLQPAGS